MYYVFGHMDPATSVGLSALLLGYLGGWQCLANLGLGHWGSRVCPVGCEVKVLGLNNLSCGALEHLEIQTEDPALKPCSQTLES